MTSQRDARKAVQGWALYDFANSAYTTLIVTFIYSVYFTQQIAPDGITGTALWSRGVTVTAVLVALLSPVLGALADRGGLRRPLLLASTAITVVGVAALFLPGPGEVALALGIFIVSNVAYELCGVFYNSYLPEIAPPDKIGRVSGYGWALGYLGGLLAMAVALVVFVLPDPPHFGLDPSTGEHIRATTLLVASWFGVLSIPMFLWVKEPRPVAARPAVGALVRGAFAQLGATFGELRRYRQIVRLLAARMVYNDGLVTIFAFGPIFAAETFGFTLTEVMYWGLALNVTAGLGAFAMGFLDDRLGGRRTLFVTLVGLFVGALWAVTADSKTSLYLAGLWVGIFVGPNQAASRSLLGRFVPREKETEFFGFFAFSGKAIAFMGPLLLGIVTEVTGSQRWGMATILAFFVIGGLLLATVDEAEGRATARGPE
ncbi:MFS transporter [Gemmatimonadota bacterium Y43]|uniref:MFS transporter n=1 Tax=Gaopeijia maritima TaxID=3119007 RepID=UPI003288F6DF